jgi:hypothetical protein
MSHLKLVVSNNSVEQIDTNNYFLDDDFIADIYIEAKSQAVKDTKSPKRTLYLVK